MNHFITTLISAVVAQTTMECKAATAYEVGLAEKAIEHKTAAALLQEDVDKAARDLQDYIDDLCRMNNEGGD